MLKQFLEIGQIVGTHGIKGELKVTPWCDSGEFLTKFKKLYTNNGTKEMKVISARVNKNVVLISFEGINSINEGDLLRDTVLYINRQDAKLEEGRYFVQDLIGLDVLDVDDQSKNYGKITDVFKTGSNDVYEIKGEDNKAYYIPVIADVVVEKKPQEGYVKIRVMKGLFTDED